MDIVKNLWNVDAIQVTQVFFVKFQFVPKLATETEDIVENLENADAKLVGGARTVTFVFLIQDVSMEIVEGHGSATAKKAGEDCYVMKN